MVEKKNGSMNPKRTMLLICYMVLAAFLAFIEATDTLAILTGIGGVLLAYIGLKGPNVQD